MRNNHDIAKKLKEAQKRYKEEIGDDSFDMWDGIMLGIALVVLGALFYGLMIIL